MLGEVAEDVDFSAGHTEVPLQQAVHDDHMNFIDQREQPIAYYVAILQKRIWSNVALEIRNVFSGKLPTFLIPPRTVQFTYSGLCALCGPSAHATSSRQGLRPLRSGSKSTKVSAIHAQIIEARNTSRHNKLYSELVLRSLRDLCAASFAMTSNARSSSFKEDPLDHLMIYAAPQVVFASNTWGGVE